MNIYSHANQLRDYQLFCKLHGFPRCPKCGTKQIQLVHCSSKDCVISCRHCSYMTSQTTVAKAYDEIKAAMWKLPDTMMCDAAKKKIAD